MADETKEVRALKQKLAYWRTEASKVSTIITAFENAVQVVEKAQQEK